MPYATVADVATQLLREVSSLSTVEQAKITSLLPVADLRITQAVPSVPDRIASGDLNAAVVTVVAASLVARSLPAPSEGVTETEEAVDDWRRRERRQSPSQGMALTDEEVLMLSPSEQDADAAAFSIQPAGVTPYVTYPAPTGAPYL